MDRASSEEIVQGLSKTLTKLTVGLGNSLWVDHESLDVKWSVGRVDIRVFHYQHGDGYLVNLDIDLGRKALLMYREAAAEQVKAGKGFLFTDDYESYGHCNFDVSTGATCRWVQRELVLLKRVCDASDW